MFKIIFLLTPLYVTLFWSILLNGVVEINTNPKRFLGLFMIVSFVVYLSHFLYFSPLPEIYIKIDALYQYASLLVYPLYFIYFRLLTVDQKFSLKKHGWYLFVPTLILILYFIGIIITPSVDYKTWVFDKNMSSNVIGIKYLNVINQIIKIVFILQVICTLTGNFYLIHKYRYKAEKYYSDIQDSKINKILILNVTLVITAISSISLSAIGKNFFLDDLTGLMIASVIFSSMLFIIGWLGFRQKSINPAFEVETEERLISEEELPASNRQLLLEKIICLFKDDKIYLNNKLTIQDIAQTVGTNRTYVSSIINQQFHQNFCTFVNNYRIEELERIVYENSEYSSQILAESSGFGSVDSLKRAIHAKNKCSFSEWKKAQIKIVKGKKGDDITLR